MDLVSELKGDLCIVTNALEKIKEDNDNNETQQDTTELPDGDPVFGDTRISDQTQIDEIISTMKDIQSLNGNDN